MARTSPRLPQMPDGAAPEARPGPNPVIASLGAFLLAAGSFIMCGYATSVALDKQPDSGYGDSFSGLGLVLSSIVTVPLLMIGWTIWANWLRRSATVPGQARWLPLTASGVSVAVVAVGLWQGYGRTPLPPKPTMFVLGCLIIACLAAMVTAAIKLRRNQSRTA